MRTKQEYKDDNKEKIKKEDLERYHKNKERLNSKITCECGSIIMARHQVRHCKTITHQNYLKSKETKEAPIITTEATKEAISLEDDKEIKEELKDEVKNRKCECSSCENWGGCGRN